MADLEEALTSEQFAAWWKQTGEHELRQLLLWRWDPIGVAELFPNTADEYDGYAPQIVQILRRGGPAEELADHLAPSSEKPWASPLPHANIWIESRSFYSAGTRTRRPRGGTSAP